MFWTESIWPLEGLKYIIVQAETSGDFTDAVCAALHFALRHADKVATVHMDKHFFTYLFIFIAIYLFLYDFQRSAKS